MEALKTIANISGYPGLYRIVKPGRSGVIVEAIDAKKAKTMMGPQARVSVLNDISMYVDRPDSPQSEQSVPLSDILMSIADKFGDELPVTPKADGADLASFMDEVLPDYDRDRVRDADIKKLVSWYTILRQYAPDIFEVAETPTDNATPVAETTPHDSTAAEEEKAAE